MEIQKLTIQKLTIAGKKYEYPDTTALVGKLNELCDAVNELQTKVNKLAPTIDFAQPKVKENVQPDYVVTAYMTDGHTKEYYGQNGASIVTDHPLPAGYVIAINEPETKGGDNE